MAQDGLLPSWRNRPALLRWWWPWCPDCGTGLNPRLPGHRFGPRGWRLMLPRSGTHSVLMQPSAFPPFCRQLRRACSVLDVLREGVADLAGHPEQPASLVKNRRSREHARTNRSHRQSVAQLGTSPNGARGARITAVFQLLIGEMIRVPGRQQQAEMQNRKQEVLLLITCEKHRNPLNSRSQSSAASNRTLSEQAMAEQSKAEMVPELITVRLTAKARGNTSTTLSKSGPFPGPCGCRS